MKKVAIIILSISIFCSAVFLAGCDQIAEKGNDVIDTFTFDYARIGMFDGEVIEVELEWYGIEVDYEYAVIKGKDGRVYFTGVENIELYDNPDVDIDAAVKVSLGAFVDQKFDEAIINTVDGEVLNFNIDKATFYGRKLMLVQATEGYRYYISNDRVVLISNP